MRTLVAIALLAIAAPISAGCGCQTALADGVLVNDGKTLVLQAQTGDKSPIAWPAGYRVEQRDGKLAVVDLLGNVKAREGDHIQVGGGLGTDNVFHACGEIVVVPP